MPLSVAEVRRLLLVALQVHDEAERAFRRAWSHWRRQHQARARRSHYQRRLTRLPARPPPPNSTR